MKRSGSNLDENKDPSMPYQINPTRRYEMPTTSSNQPGVPSPISNDLRQSAEPQVPCSSIQPFPNQGFGFAELFGTNPNHNPTIIPYSVYPVRNSSWLSDPGLENNMEVSSSNLPFIQSEEEASSCSTTINPNISDNESETNRREYSILGAVSQSPPLPIIPYSNENAIRIVDQLGHLNTANSALTTVLEWLQLGECNQNNVCYFYNMLQSSFNHIWRLVNEKAKLKEEVGGIKIEFTQKVFEISEQFQEIWKVFKSTESPSVWRQFTNPQKKNISIWKNNTVQQMRMISKELGDDKMENYGEDSFSHVPDSSADSLQAGMNLEYQKLQKELDSLRHQLSAANEQNVRIEAEANAISAFYNNATMSLKEKCNNMDKDIIELRKFKSQVEKGELDVGKVPPKVDKIHQSTSAAIGTDALPEKFDTVNITDEEVRLVTLTASFLSVHPSGASIDYIFSYLVSIEPKITDSRYVECLLKQLPKVFKEQSTGVGAALAKKWFFIGQKLSTN